MIWFNLKELEYKLKIGEVSETDFFNYLLANIIIFSIFTVIPGDEYTMKGLIVIEVILGVVINVIGIKMTFDINSAGDKKDYLGRFLSLSLVIGSRLMVFGILIAIPVGIVFAIFDRSLSLSENLKAFTEMGIIAAIGIYYYYILTNSFKKVSQ